MKSIRKNEINVIDLFAGVGGLSLGAVRAGFHLAGAVEIDPQANEFHHKNFPTSPHFDADIASLSGKRLLKQCEIRSLHGLIGGPPCQGFSAMGKHHADDPRNSLLSHFFRLVKETNPAFFLAENVPGVLHERNRQTLNGALHCVPTRYKILSPITVVATKYGVPTLRTRVFFIGFDPEKCAALDVDDFSPPSETGDYRVRDALQSLPAVRSSWQNEHDSWRAVGEMEKSVYAKKIQRTVPDGVGDPTALELYAKKRLVSGFLGTIHTNETVSRFQALREGETDPISRSTRLHRNGYCPTLRAGTGAERGSYQAVRPVHPTSPRVITPREAARLQGFPDWFQFHPTKWHAFRQIGNSVSPIVAEILLTAIRKKIAAS